MGKGQFASLTAGLLARKGEAVPASTGFENANFPSTGAPPPEPKVEAAEREEEATDMKVALLRAIGAKASNPEGEKVEAAKPVPEPKPKTEVKLESAKISRPSFRKKVEEAAVCNDFSKVHELTQEKKRSAVTLRLEPIHYLCLKMAGAKLGRTNQDILTKALESYLKSLADSELKDCNCLQKLIMEEMEAESRHWDETHPHR